MTGYNYFPQILALEPRILFDGALAIEASDAVTPNSELEYNKEPTESYNKSSTRLSQIIFVIGDIQISKPFENTKMGHSEVVVLNLKDDGIYQIQKHLNDRQDIQSIHIVSHGSEGQINIGKHIEHLGTQYIKNLETHEVLNSLGVSITAKSISFFAIFKSPL